jgi:hypothetical protein
MGRKNSPRIGRGEAIQGFNSANSRIGEMRGNAVRVLVRGQSLSIVFRLRAARRGDRRLADVAMRRIAQRMRKGIRGTRVSPSQLPGENCVTKLLVEVDRAQIKIEVTPVLRGCYEPVGRGGSARVEEEFGFAEIQVVNFADLYAGKIVAALDRQHLRDLFDVRDLMAHQGIDDGGVRDARRTPARPRDADRGYCR